MYNFVIHGWSLLLQATGGTVSLSYIDSKLGTVVLLEILGSTVSFSFMVY